MKISELNNNQYQSLLSKLINPRDRVIFELAHLGYTSKQIQEFKASDDFNFITDEQVKSDIELCRKVKNYTVKVLNQPMNPLIYELSNTEKLIKPLQNYKYKNLFLSNIIKSNLRDYGEEIDGIKISELAIS